MNCESVQSRLMAWLDEELTAQEQGAVATHLATCASCQNQLLEWKKLQGQLQTHFAPLRTRIPEVAAAVLDQLEPKVIRVQPVRPTLLHSQAWRSGMVVLMAAAAGFLLAWTLLPTPMPREPISPLEVAKKENIPEGPIQLTVASGPVEMFREGRWQTMPTGGMVNYGERVRTAARGRCEFRTADGSEVRLNHATEIVFAAPRLVKLQQGQVWSTVAPAKQQFQLVAAVMTITALGTQFDVRHEREETVLSVLEGKTRIDAAGKALDVPSGHQVVFDGKSISPLEQRQEFELFQATNWVHELLVLKGRSHPELVRRINDIFASIGQTKMEFLVEQEIRTLGDHAVVPLARYLQSARSKHEDAKRQRAAKLLADLAQPGSIGDLLPLLEDENANVRGIIAAGLRRLTGQDLGFSTDEWRWASAEARKKMQAVWERWWNVNQGRFLSQ